MRDLYMWAANIPNGPSVKFLVENSKYLEYFVSGLQAACTTNIQPDLSKNLNSTDK